ncbi:MAG: hypothetical protein ACRC2V_23330 [Xenococcaceae cyanobacterium]
MIKAARFNNYSDSQFQKDSEIWESLKQAIANSSGFGRWRSEQNHENETNLDDQVRRYLKETLNTLAY